MHKKQKELKKQKERNGAKMAVDHYSEKQKL